MPSDDSGSSEHQQQKGQAATTATTTKEGKARSNPVQRGSACLVCRKRKLKCDALKPHCSACLKTHKAHLAALPLDSPDRTEFPECVWDDEKDKGAGGAGGGEKRRRTEGAGGVGRGKLEAMESKIADLERQLKQVGSGAGSIPVQMPTADPSSFAPPPQPSFNLSHYPFSGPPVHAVYQQFHQPYQTQIQNQQLHQQQQQQQPAASTAASSSTFFLPQTAPTPTPYAHPLPPATIYNPHPHRGDSTGSSSNGSYVQQPPPFLHHQSSSSSSATGPSSVHSLSNVSSPNQSINNNKGIDTGTASFQAGGGNPYHVAGNGNSPFGGGSNINNVAGGSGSNGLNQIPVPTPVGGTSYEEAAAAAAALENEAFFHSLIYPSYPKTLPPPSLLHSLVETFFEKVPTVHKVLHKTQFLTSLHSLPPSHPGYPHPSVLHAICALASRFSGRTEVTPASTSFDSEGIPTLKDTVDMDSFGGKHAEFAKGYMEEEFRKGERLFDALLACVILTAFDYQNARWVQVWLSSALCCRLAVPLGVNESSKARNYIPGSKPSLLPKTDDELEKEQRRRVFWLGFMADRMAGASSGWASSLDEADVGAELPCKLVDFLRGTKIPENPQTLSSPDLFTYHPPDCTDSFVLHLKSLILLSRVKQFNRRLLKPPQWPEINKIPDPRSTRAFQTVQDQVEKYRQGFPREFKDPIRGAEGDGSLGLDGDLFLAHTIPFVAMIVLHENHVDLMDKNDPSSKMMLTAARGMLATIFLLLSTSYDLGSLHPFTAFCWFIGGRSIVRFYQAALFVGDERASKAALSEIEVFRSALAKFGEKIPLAHRQLQMLDMALDDARGFPSLSTEPNECVIVSRRLPFSPSLQLTDPSFSFSLSPLTVPSRKGSSSLPGHLVRRHRH
ncbi:hypothetical protein BDY24DRAFT_12994 [Mrakia frigida]|uniref:uncharacterized protein n=1 Tax=Mrakia frigida TaxID=29902 RepID=UPI003FCC14E8